jgi:Skp family chaperone for outer membrane proteins
MGITVKTRKILWGRSGNRCAICKEELVLEKDPFNRTLNLGEECHIISEQSNGPRHEQLEDFNYDSAENLMLLCCNHHTMIDEQVEKFPTTELIKVKSEHEKWVSSNLDNEFEQIEPELSKEESILSFIVGKHDKEMNIESSKQILHSAKGLEIAFDEVEKIKSQIIEFVKKVNEQAPQYNVTTRENKQKIVDVIFKINTLLAQFYQAYGNSASDSYLLFGIVDGLFDQNGYAVPFYEPKNRELIRLNFSYNDAGDFGWRNQEGKKEFYKSSEITEIWLEKFFKKVLKE